MTNSNGIMWGMMGVVLMLLVQTHGQYSNVKNYIDNRKPIFEKCKTYAPSVQEERNTGTKVIKIEASDPDDDKIYYNLVSAPSEKPKFRINNITGDIYTERVFDRDEPSREKEIYITVIATDTGSPPLTDVCTFKVTIEDVNDNPPVFDKGSYNEIMSEDLKPDQIVMRISASDLDDGNNSVVEYKLKPAKDYNYFTINKNSGEIRLRKQIDRKPKQTYNIQVEASNIIPQMPQTTSTDVQITVIDSSKKAPSFISVKPDVPEIELREDFNEYTMPIATFVAESNIPDSPGLVFELLFGRTEQANLKKTFISNQTGNTAVVLLGQPLDYEVNSEYTLTMSVKNTHDIVAEKTIRIVILDVNDNIPYFSDVTQGDLLENEPPGTPVMQVRAFDNDGTAENNIVSYSLDDENQYFSIDPVTGNITSLIEFDREEREFYTVKVSAIDNSPSALYKTGEHNKGTQVFQIRIADKNDHRPQFTQSTYIADKLPEDANDNFLVIEVKALDNDTASQINYTIISGNTDDAFKIDSSTGSIRVNGAKLDYEKLVEYRLHIRAFDGLFNDSAMVIIKLENVNDNRPEISPSTASVTIYEETIPDDCLVTISARDPDIANPNHPQNITFGIVQNDQKPLFNISTDGCLRLIAPLNRDKPNGQKDWQIFVSASDNNGIPKTLYTTGEYTITLTDINDNAPFLTNKMPVVWYENQPPGSIVKLEAEDYDESQNGPPFRYRIDESASVDIKRKFQIYDNELHASEMFDREDQKSYHVPIQITDSGHPNPQSNVSYLEIIIGDVNDNAMQEGSSNIFIYNYKGEVPETKIGRIYVNDPDDWDLPDKSFAWFNSERHESFLLDPETGMITMRSGTPDNKYPLKFIVMEEAPGIPRHSVIATVLVEVKEIPEEAVTKSGSVRFYGITAEEFITAPNNGENGNLCPKDRFRNTLARYFNISQENVDVFTVLHKSTNTSFLDVRFSAHGSPYYENIKLNGMISQNQGKMEEELGMKMYMINIDECLHERVACESSCTNYLYTSNEPIQVYTNTTSFVGVNAFIQATCECRKSQQTVCYNGGTPFDDTCECIEGFEGPNCELTSIGFYGNGYALYSPIDPCDSTNISILIEPRTDSGLVVYIGPQYFNPLLNIQDFLALELVNGYPVVTADYGTGTVRIVYNYTKLEMNRIYQIDIILQKTSIEMIVDGCRLSKCIAFAEPPGENEFLNVNNPIHLGGSSVDLEYLSASFKWNYTPQKQGYNGCVRRFAIDRHVYNLGQPSVEKNSDSGCNRSVAATVSFGIDTNFLIAILVCLALLIILLLAVVVTKKRQDGWHEKDMDDIRETIIDYEDEGGGERDTDFDLHVLRTTPIYEDRPYRDLRKLQHEPNEVPDIGGFLVDKKDACDRDNDAHPLDDVRHYAYEGDGNSTGSLSSLASCTDDGDLKFDYLSNFGPRFRKLADMYGEEPSDTDSNVDGAEGWQI